MASATERAILAGGCFWGMQDLIRRYDGVISTRVGYSGGDVPNATYRNHGTHAEAIEIIFDPKVISYRRLLEFFFQIHDPTTRNRQGNDRGPATARGSSTRAPSRSAWRGHHRGCRCFGAVAREGRDGARTGGGLLGSGTRAPGLSRALSRTATPVISSAPTGSCRCGPRAPPARASRSTPWRGTPRLARGIEEGLHGGEAKRRHQGCVVVREHR